MPITLPNLDNRRYADLVEEARSLIPTYAPEWTDHNESDPGVTLIELFAYLTEMLLYRLDRVTDANRYAFLRLLDPGVRPTPDLTLEEQVRATVLALRQADRAVTRSDFEKLALEASARQDPPAAGPADLAARARCVPRRNLELRDEAARAEELPNHTSVVVVPASAPEVPQPSPKLLDAVGAYLDARRLVTNVVHVTGPRYVAVLVRVTVWLTPDTTTAKPEDILPPLEAALRSFFHPLTGGPEGGGWPFGRNVYVSEIYDILDRQRTVDYVEQTDQLEELAVVPEDKSRMKYNDDGNLVAVEIRDDELVDARFDLQLEFPAEKKTGGATT